MADTRTQFLAYLDRLGPSEAIDFSRLETHVIDGTFCPPLKDGEDALPERRSRRPSLNRVLHDEVVDASLLSYNEGARAYKTTHRRLSSRGHFCNILITVRGGAAERDERFELKQVTRTPHNWSTRVYRSAERRRLVVINTDARGAEEDVAVVRDGVFWVAQFGFSPENRRRVEAAGFLFSPEERRWQTRDARAAVALDPSLRDKIEVIDPPRRREAPRPMRRALFGGWRR